MLKESEKERELDPSGRTGSKSKLLKLDEFHNIPFEVHAYEALLMTVKSLETQEFSFVNNQIQDALLYFRNNSLIPLQVQSQIRQLKNDLSAMMSRVNNSRKALQFLTEDDEEMALMNLSLLKKKPKLYRYDSA
jgi:hypothetical protein